MSKKRKRITSRAGKIEKKKQNKSSVGAKKQSFSQEAHTAVRDQSRDNEEKRTERFSEKLRHQKRLAQLVRGKDMSAAFRLVRDSGHLTLDDMNQFVTKFAHHAVDERGRGRSINSEVGSEDVALNEHEEFSGLLSLFSESGAEAVVQYAEGRVEEFVRDGIDSATIRHFKDGVRELLEAGEAEGVIEENSEFFYGSGERDERLVGLESTTFAETVNLDSDVGEFLSTLPDDFNVDEAVRVFSAMSDGSWQDGDIDLSAEHFVEDNFESVDLETQVLLELKAENLQEAFSEYRAIYKDKQKLKKVYQAMLALRYSEMEEGATAGKCS